MQTIAWDIDDVLNDLMSEWLEDWKKSNAQVKISYGCLIENPPHTILGISLEEYQESLDLFRRQYYANLQPIPEVLAWFESYGRNAHHMALSAVPVSGAHISAEWVMRHFSGWIRGFHYIPSPRRDLLSPDYDSSKTEFLKRIGHIDVLIDDSPEHIKGARLLGIKTYLVARPWNQGGMPLSEILESLRKDVL